MAQRLALKDEADGTVSSQQLVAVARSITGRWTELASVLSSELFGPDSGQISVIQQQHVLQPFMQAHAMLGQWSNHYADRATRGKLIKAMCDTVLEKQAKATFGTDLVNFVVNLADSPAAPGSPKQEESQVKPEQALPKDGMLDLVIVTAVDVEFKAVKQVLEGAGCEKFEPFQIRKSSGEVVLGGVATSLQLVNQQLKKSSTFKVGLFQLLEMGQTGASNSLKKIEFGIESNQVSKTCFLVMVGMCAGNPGKVGVGDIMTPRLISKESGKQDSAARTFQAEATSVSISHDVQTAVQAALPNFYGYTWIEKYLPDDVKNTPSPRYLQDTILDTLRKATEGMNVAQLHKKISETKKGWPTQGIISKPVVREALDILKGARGFVTEESKRFVISEEGKSYIEDIECESDFPAPDSADPEIKNNPMIAGDLVRVGMQAKHWKELQDHVAQRKAGGFEMEGYGFLDYAEKFLKTTNRWFVKVVTDHATNESKMDYYQQYGACLAAAFLLHVLEVNPNLAARE